MAPTKEPNAPSYPLAPFCGRHDPRPFATFLRQYARMCDARKLGRKKAAELIPHYLADEAMMVYKNLDRELIRAEEPEEILNAIASAIPIAGKQEKARRDFFEKRWATELVPPTFYPNLVRRLGAKFDAVKHRYVVDCAKEIPIKIEINGTEFDIRFDAFIEPTDGPDCVVNIRRGKERKAIILGVPFLVNNGACFDNEDEEIHLYDAAFNAQVMINGIVKTHNGATAVVETVVGQ
ncbi:unnamed protein product [Bursaphelenchus xylophilus]|uniref:(pine wood nematode) hypothetical protein n=1 Tax=Bursaphelenchus xylophilus TaxID=6326 RepID=A0A1I7SRI0_BURXY|nr:unnamed protein product [Bursaphelenchus xylophilus]CAG9102355.1 unnamed protein product [Bursaphelenchus xylophilus]